MVNFWETFPRQIAYPNRIFCKDRNEFIAHYNKLNGAVNKLYVSLYKYDMNNKMDNTEIDVVGLDMDSEECYDIMKELHEKLYEMNIKHQVLFSTGGFWIFVYTKPRVYSKDIARGKIAALQEHILENTSAFFGKSKEAPVDVAIRGDAERLCRMPTSYDKGRKRYALLLSREDIYTSYRDIYNLSSNCSQERRFKTYTFCAKGGLLDPEDFEAKKMNIGPSEFDDLEYTYKVPEDISDKHKQMMNIIPEYMKPWICNEEVANWQARTYITLYLRERGFSLDQIKNFLKPFLINHKRTDNLENNWEHYEKVKTGELIFKRKDLKMPNFETLWNVGLIPYSVVEEHGRFKSPAYR